VISLPADTLFSVGSAELSLSGKNKLLIIKDALNQNLPCYIYSERYRRQNCAANPTGAEIETIFIEGHTDSTPLQRGLYTNWHLGLDRARAVYDVFGNIQNFKNEKGLPIVGVSSYADKRPARARSTDAENRRVELRFVLAYKPQSEYSANGKAVKQVIQKSLDVGHTVQHVIQPAQAAR